jgi:hypothetical protein
MVAIDAVGTSAAEEAGVTSLSAMGTSWVNRNEGGLKKIARYIVTGSCSFNVALER